MLFALILALSASAAELPRTLEVGQTSLYYETPVKAVKRASIVRDHEIWDFYYLNEGEKFMTADYGVTTRFPTGAVGSRKPKAARVNGISAKEIVFKREGVLYREVLFDFGDEIFPAQAHFYYHGLTKSRAALADKIVGSLKRL